MMEREYAIPPCRVLYSRETGFAPDAPESVKSRPLVVPCTPDPFRERPPTIPRNVPLKAPRVAAPKPAVAAKPIPPPRVAKPKLVRMGSFAVTVRRWLKECDYYYCGPGEHVVCITEICGKRSCKACNQTRVKRWRTANQEKNTATLKRYRKAHPGMGRASTARWQKKHPETCRAQKARWYAGVRADPARWAARLKAARDRKVLKNSTAITVDNCT